MENVFFDLVCVFFFFFCETNQLKTCLFENNHFHCRFWWSQFWLLYFYAHFATVMMSDNIWEPNLLIYLSWLTTLCLLHNVNNILLMFPILHVMDLYVFLKQNKKGIDFVFVRFFFFENLEISFAFEDLVWKKQRKSKKSINSFCLSNCEWNQTDFFDHFSN